MKSVPTDDLAAGHNRCVEPSVPQEKRKKTTIIIMTFHVRFGIYVYIYIIMYIITYIELYIYIYFNNDVPFEFRNMLVETN